MKAAVIILLFALSSIECRRAQVQISKNANVDFINMEGGGHFQNPMRPAAAPTPVNPVPPQQPKAPSPVTTKPAPVPVVVTQPPKPILPTQPKPVLPTQPKPHQGITSQMDLKPVQPGKPGSPVTTPGPGNVKQLVTFYDSQGKGSVIRPYSYSEAVKKGKN